MTALTSTVYVLFSSNFGHCQTFHFHRKGPLVGLGFYHTPLSKNEAVWGHQCKQKTPPDGHLAQLRTQHGTIERYSSDIHTHALTHIHTLTHPMRFLRPVEYKAAHARIAREKPEVTGSAPKFVPYTGTESIKIALQRKR